MDLAETARSLLPQAGRADWLAESEAVDLPFEPAAAVDPVALTQSLRKILAEAPVDVIVQPIAHRRKRLLMIDMDSTIIEQECIDELADAVGVRDDVAAITERAMRGELDFAESLRARVGLLRGLEVAEALSVVTQRISLTPGALTLVRTMQAQGALTILASGGFTLFTEHVARLVGFDRHLSNELDIEAGRLTGRVREPIFGRDAKRDSLIALRQDHGLAPAATIAAGDGANDLAMIAEAGLGVAFRAKPAVAAAAQARVDHGDLTALLYAQGYRRAEFVT